MKNYDYVVGEEYGRVVITKFIGVKNKIPMVECRCSCGNIFQVRYYSLRSGNTSSCGCYRSEYVAEKNKTHGLRYDPLYKIWTAIKGRCYNKNNKDYRYYGASNIVMSKEWFDSFENFYNDMNDSYVEHIEKYGQKETTLDRINPYGNYCKENCRWATWKEQNNRKHKRNFKKIPR